MPSQLSDTAGRIVNGAVVVAAILIAYLAFTAVTGDKNAADKATATALFGSFTTLIGTALGAYFGINATRDVANKNSDNNNAANARLADAHAQLTDANAKLATAKNLLPASATDDHSALHTFLASS